MADYATTWHGNTPLLIQDCPKLYEFILTLKLKRLALLNGEPLSLWLLHAVLGTSLLTVFNTGAVKCTTDGVVTHTAGLLHDRHGSGLRSVPAGCGLRHRCRKSLRNRWSNAHGKLYAVRSLVFRGSGIYAGAYATFLRAGFQRWNVALAAFTERGLRTSWLIVAIKKLPVLLRTSFVNM